MPREVTCSFALSGLHDHCNNKIAWFKSELVAEHREWLMTFVADARNSILRSQQDEPVSVLPPRTPRATRKRRGAAAAAAQANATETVSQVQENEIPKNEEPVVAEAASTSVVSFAVTPPSPQRQSRRLHKAASPVEIAKADSPVAMAPARTPSPRPPATSTRRTRSAKFEVQETPMETSTRHLRSSTSTARAATRVSTSTEPMQRESAGKSKKKKKTPLPRDEEPLQADIQTREASFVLSPQSSDTYHEEQMDLSSTAARGAGRDLSACCATPSEARSVTPVSSCSPQEKRQLRSATSTAAACKTDDSSQDGSEKMDAPSFILSPELTEAPSKSIDLSATLAADDAVRTPRLLEAHGSTPSLARTPNEKCQVRTAKSAPSTTKASLRKPARVGGKVVAAEFASPMPLCFGVQAHVKETPRAPQPMGGAAEPPSASRILRSALRKHGAEADNFLDKLKPRQEQSAALRLGAPLRAFQAPSPSNSGDEADDEQPKVLRKLNNLVSSVTSFIPHSKTPKALDGKAKQDKLKAELDAKQKQTAERKRKKEEQRLQELEEKKLKRAERELLNRKRKAEMEEERNAKLLKKTASDQPSTSRATSAAAVAAAAAQRKKDQQEELRRKEQRRLEAEAKRRQEEEQKQKKRVETAKKYTASSVPVSRTVASATNVAPSSSTAASSISGSSAARAALMSPRLAAKAGKLASPRPVKNNASLASTQLSRVFNDSAPASGRSALAPPAPMSGGSGGLGGRICTGGTFLKKTLSKTVGSSDVTKTGTTGASKATPLDTTKKTAAVAVVHQPMDTSSSSQPSAPDSTTELAHTSVPQSTAVPVAGAAKRPPTPSCSNIVRAFPTPTTTNKSGGSVVSSVPSVGSGSAGASKGTVPASSNPAPFSLRPIPEVDADVNAQRAAVGTSATLPMKTTSNNSISRSPLKSLNRTYTMPLSTSKRTDSPLGKSKAFTTQHSTQSANTSLLDSSYGTYNQAPLSPSQIYSNYNIDHIESDDPTDDEESPRRKIPKWAQQGPLKRALIDQELAGNVADNLFPVADLETPNLTRIFQRERQRYLKRTSSANWSSPLFKRM